MKKQLLFTLLGAVLCANGFGQTNRTHVPLSGVTTHKASPNNQPPYRVAAKTSAGVPRCTAMVEYLPDTTAYVTSDSTTYSYPGMRAGTASEIAILRESFKYDSGSHYYNDLTGGPYPNSDKIYQTFDGSDNIVTTLTKRIGTGGVWINEELDLYTYDGANNILTGTVQLWDSSTASWVNDSRSISTYTSTNKVATEAEQTWDASSASWVNYTNYISTYDGMDRTQTQITQQWNVTSTSWVNNFLDTFLYDGSNNLIADNTEQWNSSANAWETNYAYKATYSNFIDHLPQTQITQYWDNASSSFLNDTKYTYEFNGNTQLTYFFYQEWNSSTNDWNTALHFGRRYYYEGYTGIKTVLASTNATVYPNPNNGDFTVVVQDGPAAVLTITNIIGQTVKEISANAGKPVDIKLNQPGIYFVTILTDNGKTTSKVIVE